MFLQSRISSPRARGGRARRARAGCARLAGALALCGLGCAGLGERLRENERTAAVANARRLVAKRDCAAALPTLERAQAARELGPFAAESSWLKFRCLEVLGRDAEAQAHRRLLRDFHPDFAPQGALLPAEPAGDAPPRGPRAASATVSKALKIPRARMSPDAERSRITGDVLVAFHVDRSGRVGEIRVLENAHPLLASWAIEAIANAKPESGSAAVAFPGDGALRFHFESRWGEPESEAADGIEWLPPPVPPRRSDGEAASR